MEFKNWLVLTEKAERTSSKVPLYPLQYHTKQYSPLYHTAYAADYPVWLGLKLQPHTWQNYDRVFGKDYIPKPKWPVVGQNIPAHGHTEMHPMKWKIPN